MLKGKWFSVILKWPFWANNSEKSTNNFARVRSQSLSVPEGLKSLCFRSFTRLLSPRIQVHQRAQFAWGCKNSLPLWGLMYCESLFCFFFTQTYLILNYLFPYYFFQDIFYKFWRQRKRRKGEGKEGRKKRGKLREEAGFLTSFVCETTDDSGVESQDDKALLHAKACLKLTSVLGR